MFMNTLKTSNKTKFISNKKSLVELIDWGFKKRIAENILKYDIKIKEETQEHVYKCINIKKNQRMFETIYTNTNEIKNLATDHKRFLIKYEGKKSNKLKLLKLNLTFSDQVERK